MYNSRTKIRKPKKKAEFLKGLRKLWPILAVRPRIGRRRPFYLHYISVLILRKITKKTNIYYLIFCHLNRPLINLPYNILDYIFYGFVDFSAANFRPKPGFRARECHNDPSEDQILIIIYSISKQTNTIINYKIYCKF